jgi:hypothetical protein
VVLTKAVIAVVIAVAKVAPAITVVLVHLAAKAAMKPPPLSTTIKSYTLIAAPKW